MEINILIVINILKNILFRKVVPPWNKGKKGLQKAWNKPKLSDGSWYPNIPITCQCSKINCNEICWRGNYIIGHSKKFEGRKHTSETKKMMSENSWARTEEAKEILSDRFKGDANPSKRPEVKEKISLSLKKHYTDPDAIKQNSKSHIGIMRSEESKQKQSKSMSGENHWNFQNWKSREPYCYKFDEIFRESVRLRDSFTCQLCSKTQEQNTKRKQRLTVHHIHGDKENCYPDCITLCHSCNVRVEKKSMKKFYEKLFMNKLNDQELLLWTKRE